MNEKNLWIYSTAQKQVKTAGGLIAFGIEQYKSSKIIKDLSILNEIQLKYDSPETSSIDPTEVMPFIFSWITDTIKIIVFFENYMKAELLIHGFLVHRINSTNEKYKDIIKEQKKRPVKVKELHDIEPFVIDEPNSIIEHEALSYITLGFNELVSKESYRNLYQFDSEVLDIIKNLNSHRNKLHFLDGIEFSLSQLFIDDLKKIDLFVTSTQNRIIRG